MRFGDIQGHNEEKELLRGLVDTDRLPHALLIHGPEGVGKLAMARALVSYLHCENRTPEGDSCGQCASCRQHKSLNHLDLHFSFPTLKKNSEDPAFAADHMDKWRQFLHDDPYNDFKNWQPKFGKPNGQPVIYRTEGLAMSRDLSTTPRSSKHKVAIVWLPERFNAECANMLLKLVEEPFPDTKIIMVSNAPANILPTIFSRLQRIEIKRLPDKDLAAVLKKEFPSIPGNDIDEAVKISEGSVIKARRLLESSSNAVMLKDFMEVMRLAYQKKVVELKKWSENMAKPGREEQIRFLSYASRMLRENYLYNLGIPELNNMTTAETDFSRNFSRFITSANIIRMIEELDRAANDIAANGNAKIIFFDLAIYFILLLKS